MKVIYSDESLDIDYSVFIKSIFLAGPTPRDLETPSWRPDALQILESLNYNGTVFVPERMVKQAHIDYDDQVEWENLALVLCKHIVFWIPRNLEKMPAFTTNVEFGRFASNNKTFYGRPDYAPKNRYLDWYYNKVNDKPIHNDLYSVLVAAVSS